MTFLIGITYQFYLNQVKLYKLYLICLFRGIRELAYASNNLNAARIK